MGPGSFQVDSLNLCLLDCVQVYFTLEQLADVHFLYQYSIQYFLRILEYVLAANPPTQSTSIKERTTALKVALLAETCRRAAKGLVHEDQVMFAVRLTQIYLHGKHSAGTRRIVA